MIKGEACLIAFALLLSSSIARLEQSYSPSACPEKVSVPNGDWERGVASPWYVPAPQEEDPKVSVVSPGYKSNHALRLSVAKSNFSDFSFINPSVGKQCEGYYYRVGFALNWDTYSGPQSTDLFGCKLTIQSSYCYGNIGGSQQIYASQSSMGWEDHSFTCMAMKTGQATFTIDFSCFGNKTYEIPAFHFEADDLQITLLEEGP